MFDEIYYKSLRDYLFTTWSDIQYALPTFYYHILLKDCKNVLELGVRHGISTKVLLLALRKTGGHLTSVDINECLETQYGIAKVGLQHWWTFINENDLDVKWDKPIDMLFIDTSHTYHQTLAELEKYSPFVTGTIFLHDTVEYPCRLAVEVFVDIYPFWKYEELGGQYGLGKLTRNKMR